MSRIKKPIQLIELGGLKYWYNRRWAGAPEKESDEKEKPGWDPKISDKPVVSKEVNVLCRDGNRYI